ncbi:MAG TPA: MalY/PatB family protein [Oscillospiraceae bacterium]|nr:MalY/PatB family protein [Oscillospiraceae bacterium]
MSKYNFDEIIDRNNTNSLKYDFGKEHNMPADVMPFWVADMDFRTPPAVIDALTERSKHGIFGYTDIKEDYFKAVYDWYKNRFGFTVNKEWLIITPGVVFAICAAIRALTHEGDGVLIQRPVYYPFSSVIKDNNRKLVNNSLVYKNGRYEIDFDDFEKKITENNVKLFILCNPHNPVGRVWTKEELTRIGIICLKHKVIVISDEIHSDFVYGGNKHTPFASLSRHLSDITITCTSPSKTFNLAGLQLANIFIENESIRKALYKEIRKTGYGNPNTMGIISAQAAYEHGGEWLDELLLYLSDNISKTQSLLSEKAPKLKVIEPEGTYLLWIDFKGLGLTDKKLDDLIINKAKLWLDGGKMFGEEGSGFQRINIACPWSALNEGLNRLTAFL